MIDVVKILANLRYDEAEVLVGKVLIKVRC